MTHEGAEKRSAKRIRLDLKVQVTGPQGPPEVLMAHDWAKGGVFLRTRSPLRLGTSVELAIVLRKPLGRQAVRGTVVQEGETLLAGRRTRTATL